ncbi:hypothetical protein [Roseibium aggregatum]|uniref:Uncharacterized protein n=1 Tax=Roseibium aggregatum TaxID=187304 RepID=A0A939IYS9_9HYPH|nr:hypothetical protein [Roseibium aggregatum]MBN9669311.1 hypothetical protein [Roseibium aggregatum]
MGKKKYQEDVVLIFVFSILLLSAACYFMAWRNPDITGWLLFEFFAENLVFFERRYNDTLHYSQSGAIYYFCSIAGLAFLTPGLLVYDLFLSKRGFAECTATRVQTFTSLTFVVIFFFPVFWWSASLHGKLNIEGGSILVGALFPIIAGLYICWAAFTLANVVRIVFKRDLQDA